jgi:signal transduction histidine kinase
MSTTAAARWLFSARPRSEPLLDVAIAAVVLAGTLLQLSHGGMSPAAGSRDLDPVGLALAVCSALPLIAWRRFPLGAFVAAAAASVWLAGLGYPIDLTPGSAAALFLFAASREVPTPWRPLTVSVIGGMFVAYLGASAAAHGEFPGLELMHAGLVWAVAWFAGERTRLRREHLADLQERARRAERDTERERLLAAAEERARIARDLHDSAGHAMSVIAVRAAAARLGYRRDPERSLLSMRAVESLARQTAEEINQIVGTLRDGGVASGVVQTPLGLASLDTLIAHHAAAGLTVSLKTSGLPRTLGSATDQAAYRILQEALTNTARHGGGRARIEVAFGPAAVDLTITNPLPATEASRPGGGHGLIGMRERATLLGGTLEAGRANGAFRVHAHIPYGSHRP